MKIMAAPTAGPPRFSRGASVPRKDPFSAPSASPAASTISCGCHARDVHTTTNAC